MFTGTLDLSSDPQAEQDVNLILQGDPAPIGDLVSQLNSNGTESVQTFQITRSSTTYGAKASVVAGLGASLSDGTSNATYSPPETREDGGKWHKGP